jgi:transcriptional regulator with XRE-family HTH domain
MNSQDQTLPGDLRNTLRQFREAADMTPTEVAAAMGWHPSRVIQIELGTEVVSGEDLSTLLAHYRVTAPDVAQKLVLASVTSGMPSWASYSDNRFRGVIHDATVTFFRLEAGATVGRYFELDVVPGLLQTEEYMRELFGALASRPSPEIIEELVELRLARQKRFFGSQEPLSKLFFVIDEAALRRPLGGSEVMRRQLELLRERGSLEHVSLQVIPHSIGAYGGLQGAFTVLEFARGDTTLFIERRGGDEVTRDDLVGIGRHLDLFRSLMRISAWLTLCTQGWEPCGESSGRSPAGVPRRCPGRHRCGNHHHHCGIG